MNQENAVTTGEDFHFTKTFEFACCRNATLPVPKSRQIVRPANLARQEDPEPYDRCNKRRHQGLETTLGHPLLADQLPNHLPSQPHVKQGHKIDHQEARRGPADSQHVPFVVDTQP